MAYDRALPPLKPNVTPSATTRRSPIRSARLFGVVPRWRRSAGELLPTTVTVELSAFENIATFVGGELAYMLEIERFQTKLAGSDALDDVALRLTSIFRREEGAWRLVHRHADPITVHRPPASAIEQ